MVLTFLQIATTLLCFNSTPITTGYTEIGFSNPVKNVNISKDSTPQAILWESSGVFKWNFGGIADGFKIELLKNGTSVKVLLKTLKYATASSDSQNTLG